VSWDSASTPDTAYTLRELSRLVRPSGKAPPTAANLRPSFGDESASLNLTTLHSISRVDSSPGVTSGESDVRAAETTSFITRDFGPLSNGLPDDTTIFWKVKADDNYGLHTWCTPPEGWSFYVFINEPPVITSPGVDTAYVDSLYAYRVTFTDPDGPDTVITFLDYPSWLTPEVDSIYGTPHSGSRDTSFAVTVNDGLAADTLNVTLYVIQFGGRVIYVPDDYPTIQEAINASWDTDTILVRPGTYYECINFGGRSIVLGSLFLTTGDTSYISSTIIDGDSLGTVVTFSGGEDSTTVITGFTITNGYAAGGAGTGTASFGPSVARKSIQHNPA